MSLVLQAVTGVTLSSVTPLTVTPMTFFAFNTQFNMQTMLLSPTSGACVLWTSISRKLNLKRLIHHTHRTMHCNYA